MISADYVKALACLLAWREENSNGLNGCLGVLFVIRNRALAKWHAGDWNKIMLDKNQFSSMTVPGDGQLVHYPDPTDPTFIRVLQYVDGVYDNTTADNLTSGSLYYADMSSPAYNKTGWFQKNIVESVSHPRLATIGSTSFFK
jgi:hypothetical protein